MLLTNLSVGMTLSLLAPLSGYSVLCKRSGAYPMVGRCRAACGNHSTHCTIRHRRLRPACDAESDGVAAMQLQEQQRRAAAELQTLQARCHAAETDAAALRRAPRLSMGTCGHVCGRNDVLCGDQWLTCVPKPSWHFVSGGFLLSRVDLDHMITQPAAGAFDSVVVRKRGAKLLRLLNKLRRPVCAQRDRRRWTS